MNAPPETLVQTARTEGALEPVAARERIGVIDALRGFALTGVLFANLFAFSGFIWLSEEQQAALPGGAANGIVGMLGYAEVGVTPEW